MHLSIVLFVRQPAHRSATGLLYFVVNSQRTRYDVIMHIRATGQSKMGEAKDSNDVMGDSSKTGASLSIWLTNRFLAVVAMFNIPMNSIVTISIPYLIVWFTTDRLWLKALMVIYWPFYSMMDTTPQRLTKPAFVRKLQHYCRRVPFIRATGDYFPCTLRKTCELSPEETYLFAYHPHGVISMGANLGMSTEAGHFERVFPGVRVIRFVYENSWLHDKARRNLDSQKV